MTKVKRKMVKIDEEKCNGCGLCIPSCKEGALQIVNGKAKLVSDIYCDGLGACLGECPEGAISIEEREAEEFNEVAVEKHLNKTKKPDLPCGCPGSMAKSLKKSGETSTETIKSELGNWPLQLMLVPPNAPYLTGSDLVLMADCTAFAYANAHRDFIKNRVTIIACPKLDDVSFYINKLTEMVKINNFRSIEVVMMEVPCCSALGRLVETAVGNAGINVNIKNSIIGISGERL